MNIIELGNNFTLNLISEEDSVKLPKSINYLTDIGILHHNGVQISEHLFRKGGMSKSTEKYCQLICYTNKEDNNFSNHCIVNTKGIIVLSQNNMLDSPYLINGCIASLEHDLYNLDTQTKIVNYKQYEQTTNYIFAMPSYKEEVKGMRVINVHTGEVKIID